MGFLDSLRGVMSEVGSAASDVLGDLANEAKRFKNENMMLGTMAACALVAFANGEIKDEEKQKMQGYFAGSLALKVYDQGELIAAFDDFVKKLGFDYEIGEEQCLQAVKKVGKKSDAAKLLVKVCISIAGADDDFDDEEKAVVKKLCETLELKTSDYIS